MEEMDNIIELIDEEGEAVQFELLATLEQDGAEYIALMLLDEDEDEADEEAEVVFMKVEADEDGNDCYIPVEEDALTEKLFEQFLALMEEAGEGEE